MQINNLLDYCRYYKGEKEIPKDKIHSADLRFLWKTEKLWVERMKQSDYNFSDELDNYLICEMADFSATDNIPITMKALLFCYFLHINELTKAEDFKEFYNKYYL